MIVVSHDRYFLDRTVHRIFAFEEDGKIRQYEGGYSDYLEASSLRQAKEQEIAGAGDKRAGNKGGEITGKTGKRERTERPREVKLKFSYKEQREFDGIDEEIERLEQKIAVLDQKMAEAATQYAKLNELMQEKDEAEKQLELKMDRWMYLNDLAERIAAQEKS